MMKPRSPRVSEIFEVEVGEGQSGVFAKRKTGDTRVRPDQMVAPRKEQGVNHNIAPLSKRAPRHSSIVVTMKRNTVNRTQRRRRYNPIAELHPVTVNCTLIIGR